MIETSLHAESELITGLNIINNSVTEFSSIDTYKKLAIAVKTKLSELLPNCSVNFRIEEGAEGGLTPPGLQVSTAIPTNNIQTGSGHLSVPVTANGGQVATIELQSPNPGEFTETRRAMIKVFAAICGSTCAAILKNDMALLQQNEAQLNLITHNTYNLIIKTGSDGRITWVNNAFETATGYSLQEVIGLGHELLLIGKNTEADKIEALRQAIRDKSSFSTKITTYSRHGAEYKVAMQVNPVFNNAGELNGHITVMQDITREEKYRESLQSAICQIKDISTFAIESPNPTFRFSKKELKLIFANPAAKNAIYNNRGNPEANETWSGFLKLCQDRNENFSTHIQISKTHYSCSVVYIKKQQYFNIYAADISDVICKQQELLDMKDRLSTQKSFYEDILDNIPVDIVVFDRSHNYIFLNKEAINDDTLRKWMIGRNDFDYARLKGLPDKFAWDRRSLFEKVFRGEEQPLWLDEHFLKNGEVKYKERRFSFYGNTEYVMGYAIDVTRLKKIQSLLEENYAKLLALQTRYTNIIQNTHDIIFTLDGDGNITFANHAWHSKMGYPEQETVGTNIFKYKHAGCLQYCMGLFQQIKTGVEVVEVAYCLVTADGKNLECEGTLNASFENGQLVEIRQYLRDVTESNSVKAAQELQREKLVLQNKTLARLSAKDFSQFDTFETALKYITTSATKSLGVSRICAWHYSGNSIRISDSSECRGEADGANMEFFEKDFPVFFKKLKTQLSIAVSDIFTKEPTHEFAAAYFEKNKIASILFIPIKFNNVLSGMLSCEYTEEVAVWSVEDKAFAKSIADIVSLTGEAMKRKEAEKTFKILFDKSNDPILIIDDQLILADCNESAIKILGYLDKAHLLRKKIFEISPAYQPDALPSAAKSMQMRDKSLAEGHNQFEWLHEKADGTILPVEVMLTPIILNEKQFYYTVWRDISHRKKAENELLLKNNLLVNQNKELKQFAYIASHDLQEPIKTMIQCSELLQVKFSAREHSADEVKFIEFIVKSSHRMQELVTGLLEYTRIGNQRSLVKIDCNTLVSDVLGDLALALEQSNASLQIGKLPELLGYPSELRQLFQNLISNALKFVPAGRRPEVIITAKNAGGYWEFSVQDNGIGIDPKHFEKIFVLFKRLHNRSDYDGTGIGLAHCKKIVQLHSGEIHVESEVERGSTFCFTINKNLYNERDFE